MSSFLILSLLSPCFSDTQQLVGLHRGGPFSDAIDENATSEAPPAANVTVPLHAHSGTHHVHIYVGSPPQRQTLIVDTGSRVMSFPCKPCRTCGSHASPYFDPAASTTYKSSRCGKCLLEGISTCSLFGEQCELSQKYTEGSSWSASEVEDLVWLGTPDVLESVEDHMQLAVPFAFGCQTSSRGLFKKQYADGILGLARHDTSIVSAYYQAGAILRNAFSLCMTREGGHMSVGGSLPKKHHLQPMQMTPITREHGWYSVEVDAIYVGDIMVADKNTKKGSLMKAVNSGKGCILDSGTTDTYLPSSLSKAFEAAVHNWTGGLTDFSRRLRVKIYTFAQFQALPEITFVLANNATISIHPNNYMEGVLFQDGTEEVQSWKGTKQLTNRIYLEDKEGAVLGANALLGHDILYDVQGHQIGIAKAECSEPVHSLFSQS